MRITFVSNYINHHQLPFSQEMINILGDGYKFIQTEPMDDERIRMGWDANLCRLPFVMLYQEDEGKCAELINDSDVVIFGGTENEEVIQSRLKSGRLTIRYSERLYREGRWKAVSPRGLIKKYHDHTRYRMSNVYLLCAGAYVAGDFNIIRAYPGKKMKWGYFTQLRTYRGGYLEKLKKNIFDKEHAVRIMWAGRFMRLKHPEYAVRAAAELNKLGIPFRLMMTGGGDDEICGQLHDMCRTHGIEDRVTFTGFMRPDEVRDNMERANIFLFTSSHLEGWGAVLNEAMNSGCAVVACSAAGAVPYLVNDGVNGFTYRENDIGKFIQRTVMLAQDADLRERLGSNAYETIACHWNAKTASENLMRFIEKHEFAFEGPCSRA